MIVFGIHYAQFYYACEYFHNKIGINQLILVKFSEYIYMINIFEF